MNGGGDTNSGLEQATQPALNNTEDPQQTQENIPTEVATILDSAGATINDSDAELIRKMFPGMVDNDNQPLPENIPTEEEQNAPSQPQFFMAWEHSGSCFHCLEGGCKTKACINFNTDVKPTVEQQFEIFFFKPFIMGTIIPQTNKCLQEDRHHPLTYGEFLHWLSLWFLMATINGPDKAELMSQKAVTLRAYVILCRFLYQRPVTSQKVVMSQKAVTSQKAVMLQKAVTSQMAVIWATYQQKQHVTNNKFNEDA